MQQKKLKRIWKAITVVTIMHDIEHPEITHVNRTGYTRDQWRAIHRKEIEDDRDRSEWDDGYEEE